ncbi:hypothetical protein AAHB54_13275 [Bacillus cereus]
MGMLGRRGCSNFTKTLSKAIEDGDNIYGVIASTSENHGGKTNSLTTPNVNAQTELLVEAYRKAKINPSTVTYLESHGTGTALGDPIEINALKKLLIVYINKQMKLSKVNRIVGLVQLNQI